MRIALESSRWLWLVPVCVLLVWAVELRWPMGRGWSRWAGATLRTVLLVGVVIAAAGPLWLTEDAGVSAVAVVDVSASVSDEQLSRARQVVSRLQELARPPHELRVVRFATVAEQVIAPGTAASRTATSSAANDIGGLTRLDAPLGLGTDIAGALGLAAGLADRARQPRLVLLSDGRATAGDALAQARRLAAAGLRLDHVTLAPATGAAEVADVAVRSIEAPADVRPHATFPLRIGLLASRPARVRVTIARNGKPVAESGRDQEIISLPAGETSIVRQSRVEDDTPAVFTVDVLHDGDAHPENDRGVLMVAAPAPPRAVVLASATADATALAGALRAQSIEVRIAAGGRHIAASLQPAQLSGADLVVLCDLPRSALPERHLAALETYVRDGGGLLVTGGPNAYGPGGWDGSRLETMLPVRLEEPRQRDEPSLALALAIDRSGSMSGAKMDLTKQAARATAELLPVDDQLSVIAFDSQATTIVPLQRAANRLRIATDIGRIQPTGGTNILAGLREAVEQLSAARAIKKHIILLSDGQSATEGITELVDAAVGARITISTVGVGEGVDESVLQLIARHGGGRYYHTRDPASIPRIFTRETSEVTTSSIVERSTAAVPRKRAGITAGIAWENAPPLRGFVRTQMRPQGELLLASDAGDPLLARWPLGLGQVVAWTSDLGPRWAGAWTHWRPFPQVWGQIARATMRARAAQRFPIAARVDGGGGVQVSVEAVAADDSFVVGLDATVEVTSVDAQGTSATEPPRRIPMTETAPGRYDARFPVAPASGARPPAALLIVAKLASDGRPVAQALGHLSVPLAAELLPLVPGSDAATAGAALLAGIAAATGGGALQDPANVFQLATTTKARSRSLRPALLASLAMLFVLEIALRRLIMNRARPVGRRG